MSEGEFLAIFDECMGRIPDYATRGITGYLRANKINVERGIDEDKVDKMQEKMGARIPVAGTHFGDDTWWIIFRKNILSVSPIVVRPIIIHELIHAWLHPVLHPRSGQTELANQSRKMIAEFRKEFEASDMAKLPYPAGCDYEELLVTWIGLRWNTGEAASHAWTSALKSS